MNQLEDGSSESLVKCSDGLVHSVNIQTKNGVTNRLVSKFYPLELSEHVINTTEYSGSQEDCTTANNLDVSSTNYHLHHSAAQHARQRLDEWTKIICAHPPTPPPEDIRDC